MNVQLETTVITKELMEVFNKIARDTKNLELQEQISNSNSSTFELRATSYNKYSELKERITQTMIEKLPKDVRSNQVLDIVQEELSDIISDAMPIMIGDMIEILQDRSISKCHDSDVSGTSLFYALRSYIDSELFDDIITYFEEDFIPTLEEKEELEGCEYMEFTE